MNSRFDHDSTGYKATVSAVLFRSAFTIGAIFVSATAAAAAASVSEAQARYQQERAACISGQSHQDRATCLREAGAALKESRRGNLGGADTGRYQENQFMRCEVHAGADREDCLRRMRGEGTISGSVESGGLYRELRTTVPAR